MTRQDIIRGAVVIAALMIVFPPYVDHFKMPTDRGYSERSSSAGYHFIAEPPAECGRYCTVEIDTTRLFLQLLALGIVAGGILYTTKPKEDATKPKEATNGEEST